MARSCPGYARPHARLRIRLEELCLRGFQHAGNRRLNPGSTSAGAPAFMLTVNGSNFASKAVVNWNGNAQATTHVTSGQLPIAVPASAVATSGMIQITVTNPATSGNGMYGGGSLAQTSQAVDFTIH